MTERITVGDGEYEFCLEGGSLRCRRHGEVWRDFIGDNAVLALFRHALELQDRMNKVEDQAFMDRVGK